MKSWPVTLGVTAAGHVTTGGAWHPGSGVSCHKPACARDEIIRRPRPGDRIQTSRYGDVLVLDVGQHGQHLTVRDSIGRKWPLDRAANGYWRRA